MPRSLLGPACVLLVLCAVAWPRAEIWARSLDDQVYDVARQLMCPVCAGQTVAESDAAVAREMRAIIRRKLEAGETPAQILRYFVGQFGEGILAEPPRRGVSLLLYAAPWVAVGVGLGVVLISVRRWLRGRWRHEDEDVPGEDGGGEGDEG